MTPDSPFAPVHSRQSFFNTPRGAEALRRLDDGLGTREPFLLLSGGSGSGKTTLANEVVARWGSRVAAAFLAYPALTGSEFLEEIIRRFGAEPPDGASRSKLVACVEQALAAVSSRGQVAMLVVDDAQDLSLELFEELRRLVNSAQQAGRSLEVLLIGLPALEARFDDPTLAALRQRVSLHARLEPLSAAETRGYLHHRVTAVGGDGPSLFSRKTCRDIAARTGGVPRQINTLAAEALRVAREGGAQTVGPEHVQMAAIALGGFVPTGNAREEADADSADAPVTIASPRAPAIAKAPDVAHSTTGADNELTTRSASAAPIEASANPAPPASHDPREWVARFVGDMGPLQISSRARPEPTWEAEAYKEGDADSPSPTEAPAAPAAPRGGQHRARRRPRSTARDERSASSRSRRDRLRLATTALLAAILVASAVTLVMRASGHARSRTGQVAAVTTTAITPKDADKGSSPVPPVASRSAGVSPPARAGEHHVENSTTRGKGPYSLDVGGASDLESALGLRDRMQALTGFEGWVVPAPDGGSGTYRIVLGPYRSYERATAAADMLLNSKTLSDVTVVPLPPRSARQ